MSRVRCLLILAMGLVLVASSFAAAQAPAAAAPRRGGRFVGGRDSLLGLLSRPQVQKELKLNEEQTTKITEMAKKLRGEIREQSAALREIAEPEKRRAKRAELNEQLDAKTREMLRDVLSREQVMRLYQIRVQVRGPLYALNNRWIANRLQLTEEQKGKLAEIDKQTQQKLAELSREMRGLSREQRREKMTELNQKRREIRQKADEEALKLLSAEQKKGYERIKGENFELQRRARGGQRRAGQ